MLKSGPWQTSCNRAERCGAMKKAWFVGWRPAVSRSHRRRIVEGFRRNMRHDMQQNSSCLTIFRMTPVKRSRLYNRQCDDKPGPLISVYHLDFSVVKGNDTVRD